MLNRGNTQAVTLRKPLPVNDVSFASTIISQSDTLATSAGTAGTKGTLMLSYGPVASANGDLVGNFSDSSLAITSTTLTTEVPFEKVAARASADQNLMLVGDAATDYKAYLANGEFYVIYETGRIFYSKADANTSVVAVYKYRGGASSSVPGSVVDVAKVGGQTTKQAVVVPTATLSGMQNTLPWAVYNATPTTRTEGQGGPLQANTLGGLLVEPNGNVAHDAVDAGNPIKQGGRAVNVEIAAVANNDRVDFVATLTGKQIMMPYANKENFVSGATSDITDTTATPVIAGVASNNLYITHILVTNSHATVGTFVNIIEESSATVYYTGYAAAVGGGFSCALPVPIRLPTQGKGLQVQCVTTGANVRASASGFKGVY